MIIAAFPWGAYLGAEALEQGIDAMVSSLEPRSTKHHPDGGKSRW